MLTVACVLCVYVLYIVRGATQRVPPCVCVCALACGSCGVRICVCVSLTIAIFGSRRPVVKSTQCFKLSAPEHSACAEICLLGSAKPTPFAPALPPPHPPFPPSSYAAHLIQFNYIFAAAFVAVFENCLPLSLSTLGAWKFIVMTGAQDRHYDLAPLGFDIWFFVGWQKSLAANYGKECRKVAAAPQSLHLGTVGTVSRLGCSFIELFHQGCHSGSVCVVKLMCSQLVGWSGNTSWQVQVQLFGGSVAILFCTDWQAK